jgi:glutamate dehydrogenase/leucine dehydrogenase
MSRPLRSEDAPVPAGRSAAAMWMRYAAFLRQPPELTMAWQDAETGARAWLVINSLHGGAAGGGTRMRLGVDPREVVYLAKAMELKFSIAGPPIGGAKTGIDFDPADPRKAQVLERWWRAIEPYLRERYGTGGDLNVDEVLEVIPTFERIGLHHPQQGVIRGHLRYDESAYREVVARMTAGVEAPVGAAHGVGGLDLTVADMITGYGVAESVVHLLLRQRRDVEGTRVVVEGFGNVGAACALYLARAGARIVTLTDARHTLADEEGVDAAGIEALIRRRSNKLLPADDERVRPGHDAARIWARPADVFVCAALSESITQEVLDRMHAAGVRVIAAGANQPFREVRIGSTRMAQQADRRFAVLADIVANCGMARTFGYLMEPGSRPDAAAIAADCERTIRDTIDEVLERSGSRSAGLLSATLGLALDRIGAP